jgi:hypothetical protein
MEAKSRVCPACGGHELHSGKLARGEAFIPDVSSWLTFAPALSIQGLVCVDCGFVGHYLDDDSMERLRQKRS